MITISPEILIGTRNASDIRSKADVNDLIIKLCTQYEIQGFLIGLIVFNHQGVLNQIFYVNEKAKIILYRYDEHGDEHKGEWTKEEKPVDALDMDILIYAQQYKLTYGKLGEEHGQDYSREPKESKQAR